MDLIYKIIITFLFSSSFISLIILLYYTKDNNIKLNKIEFLKIIFILSLFQSIFMKETRRHESAV